MNAKIDRTGHRYGRLVALREGKSKDYPGGDRHLRWVCRCDCGGEAVILASKLTNGHTRSCGCLQSESRAVSSVTHGKSDSPEFAIWGAIKRRCFNPADEAYDRYGGRGITMDPEWAADFAAFYAYIGDRPAPGLSIDRIDNDGSYVPGNIKWSTAKEQANNRRPRTRKTKCHVGHDLAGDNLYVHEKTGYFYCKTCRVARDMKYKYRRAAT